jgi:hypothetical protein
MMRGLFGKKVQIPGVISGFGGGTFNMDGTQATPMQGEISYTPQAQAIMQGQAPMPEQRSFWQGGGKFTGRDALAGALAAIGDGLRGWSGGPTGAIEGLMASRMAPAQEAAAMAAEQRKRAAELADYRSKLEIQQEFAQPEDPKPGSFEWYQTATPEQRAIYDQYNPVIATTWQGPVPVSRSSLGGAPAAPVGRLTPIQPSIANTPAPQTGANGMPTTLTRQQYQAVVNSMGAADTEAWARRNNVRVVD